MTSGPRDLPETRPRPRRKRKPYDDSEDGISGYLPELRRDSAFSHDGTDEDEDEAEL